MATKKRKTTKKRTPASTRRPSAKKEAPVEHELPGGFWRQIFAVLLIALALFFVITWFGHGGSALNTVHDTVTKGIGLATYFIPFILVYIAVRIFRSENNRISIAIYIASILMLLWLSGVGAIWNFGGIVGDWLNGIMTQALDQTFVSIIYIVLIFITRQALQENRRRRRRRLRQEEETRPARNQSQLWFEWRRSHCPSSHRPFSPPSQE